MKRFLVLCALVGALVGAAPSVQAQTDRDGLQRWINLVNRSGITLREFYMTDVDTNGWGDDRLGDRVVEPGQVVRVVPTARQRARGYCRFDMKAVFANNATVERRGVNLCQVSEFVCTSASNCAVR